MLSIILMLIGLVLGIVLVVKGSDVFIDGAADIASKIGVSEAVIGLTLVAFATSLPELAVSLAATLQGSTDIAFGTILGSNVANLCLILGLSAVIMPLAVSKDAMTHAMIMTYISILLFLFVLFDGSLGPLEGLAFLIIYVWFTVHLAREERGGEDALIALERHREAWRDWLYVVGGAAGVIVGARVLVASASGIARSMGVSEFIIGLTIIAVGTSIPEMASSVTAAIKKYYGIAVGNVVGSNILNIVLVLGASSLIRPIPAGAEVMYLTIPFVIGVSILSVYLLRRTVAKWTGALLLALYAVFLFMTLS